MSQSFRLKPVQDLATARVDEATRKLGELISEECECQRKLELLESYRADYRARFQEAARQGLAPDAWRNFTVFLEHIEAAIAEQRAVLEQSRQATACGQRDWLTQRNEAKAFDVLAQRHRAEQTRLEQRHEQRLCDEHAAKTYRQWEAGE